MALAPHLADGGGVSSIAEHGPYSREWARKFADRVDAERAASEHAPPTTEE